MNKYEKMYFTSYKCQLINVHEGYNAEADEIELLKEVNNQKANSLRISLSNSFGLPRLEMQSSKDILRFFWINASDAGKIRHHDGFLP